MIRDALIRLKQSIPKDTAKATRKSKRAKAKAQKVRPLSPDELSHRLLTSGLVTQLPDPAQDIDDDADSPLTIKGEPLSETIIRERR